MAKNIRYIVTYFIVSFDCFFGIKIFSQTYLGIGFNDLFEIEISNSACGCSVNEIVPSDNFDLGISYCPDGNLFGLSGLIYQIDPLTGISILIYPDPPWLPPVEGLLCDGDSIFYFMSNGPNGHLYILYPSKYDLSI